jgi:hypothetical protein
MVYEYHEEACMNINYPIIHDICIL